LFNTWIPCQDLCFFSILTHICQNFCWFLKPTLSPIFGTQ
jgi:hypothetical protein